MITRNNYEEFFLLYVDNELSPAEREAVERFVEGNPDLREEWELLLQCRISPDEAPVFTGKELLLREENPSMIDATNYETWFLSYIDGELDEPARQAVNDFIRRHPDKNVDLQRLQRTVNIPDKTIMFPHKETLYRKEERRIAWLPFARIAVAALLLGAIGLLIFHPFRKTNTPPVAITPSTSPVLTDTPSAALADATPAQQPVHVPAGDKTPPVQPVVKKQLTAVTPGSADTLHLYKSKQPEDDNEPFRQGSDMTASGSTNTRTQQTEPDRSQKATTEPVLAKVDLPIPDNSIAGVKMPPSVNVPPGNIDPSNKVVMPDPMTSFATQALLSRTVAYTEDGSVEDNIPPKKNKLRGIFRKVTRALERPANRQDDDDRKVLIGGFQFALQ